MNYNHEKL